MLYSDALKDNPEPVTKKRQKKKSAPLDKKFGPSHTGIMLQLSGNKNQQEAAAASLVDLRRGDVGILDRIDLPHEDARRLMELGFLPGTRITAGLSAPGGDPRVFQVDGSEIALRRETARLVRVWLDPKPKPGRAPGKSPRTP
jgi:ferrous iron transport protein A